MIAAAGRAISPGPVLALFWDDLLDNVTGEYFEHATLDSFPGRVFNLYFRNRIRLICGSDVMNLMISIHESSNR